MLAKAALLPISQLSSMVVAVPCPVRRCGFVAFISSREVGRGWCGVYLCGCAIKKEKPGEGGLMADSCAIYFCFTFDVLVRNS
jgi:hypothetical protein